MGDRGHDGSGHDRQRHRDADAGDDQRQDEAAVTNAHRSDQGDPGEPDALQRHTDHQHRPRADAVG